MAKTKNITETTVPDFMEEFKRKNEELKKRGLSNKDIVLNKLKKLKINYLVVNYQGSGDSGDFENPVAYKTRKEVDAHLSWDREKKDKINALLDSEKISITKESSKYVDGGWKTKECFEEVILKEAIKDVAYELLEAKHPGWENNDGSDGYFIIDVKEKKIDLSHTSYYTQSETYCETWE